MISEEQKRKKENRRKRAEKQLASEAYIWVKDHVHSAMIKRFIVEMSDAEKLFWLKKGDHYVSYIRYDGFNVFDQRLLEYLKRHDPVFIANYGYLL